MQDARAVAAFQRVGRLTSVLGFAALLVAGQASAQPVDELFSDASVLRLTRLVLSNLGKARCGGAPCAPATEAEIAAPPVTLDQARLAMRTAVASANAEHCGLDWQQRSFLPMVRELREGGRLAERQMAILTMLHGVVQGATVNSARKDGPCSAAMKAALDTELAPAR
jgi:hypothetical protein